jgi:hypothetical protein
MKAIKTSTLINFLKIRIRRLEDCIEEIENRNYKDKYLQDRVITSLKIKIEGTQEIIYAIENGYVR